MRAEIIFTQITLFASISFTSFYHVITLTMRTEHWNEHHRSFLCFSLLSLFAKIQYNINQLKYPDVKHDRRYPHHPASVSEEKIHTPRSHQGHDQGPAEVRVRGVGESSEPQEGSMLEVVASSYDEQGITCGPRWFLIVGRFTSGRHCQ